MSTFQILIVIICMILAFLTIPVSILINMSERGTFSFKHVGGIRFIRIGRIRVQFSIAQREISTEEKEFTRAMRAENRAELHYNAAFGRKIRFIMLQQLARKRGIHENKAASAKLEAFLSSDRWAAVESAVEFERNRRIEESNYAY